MTLAYFNRTLVIEKIGATLLKIHVGDKEFIVLLDELYLAILAISIAGQTEKINILTKEKTTHDP